MNFQNMNLVTKIVGSFVLASLFFIVVGYIGTSSMNQYSKAVDEVKHIENFRRELSAREVDHLKFMQKVNTALYLHRTPIQVTKDERNCKLGLFLNGSDRIKMEKHIPALAQVFSAMEIPHRKLHQSVSRLEEMLDANRPNGEIQAFYGEEAEKNMVNVQYFLREADHLVEQRVEKVTTELEESRSSAIQRIVFVIAFGLFIAVFIALYLRKSIHTPVNIAKESAERLASGDFTVAIPTDRQDEIGNILNSLHSMSSKQETIIRQIADDASVLQNNSDKIAAIAGEFSSSAHEMNDKANNVASATEELSVTMNTISSAMEQTTSNMDMVAIHTEEMTSTINEIAKNSENARMVTSEAVQKVDHATFRVNELGKASEQVNRVLEVIVDIAEQTKLLALNATIEAARAGEAGKGFAVVANEVKELARQTADATEEIRDSIEAIQGTSQNTIQEISDIRAIIQTVNEAVASIATAVEEQNVTTKDIANNIAEAGNGVKEATYNVAQAAEVSQMISGDIQTVSAASQTVYETSAVLMDGVHELEKISQALQQVVSTFRFS